MELFKLDSAFIDTYKSKDPKFGFNGLGELVYLRTYSRLKSDSTNEKWYETIRRVVEGTYTIQKEHIDMIPIEFEYIDTYKYHIKGGDNADGGNIHCLLKQIFI